MPKKPSTKKTPKTFGYIVAQQSYTYDDSFHHADEDGTKPVMIFDDKDQAKAHALKLSIEDLKGFELASFYEDFSELHECGSDDEFAVKFDKVLGRKTPVFVRRDVWDDNEEGYVPQDVELRPDSDNEYFNVPLDITDEQAKKLLKILPGFKQYVVIKVEKA